MITWSKFSPKAIDFLQNSNARLNILYGAVRSSKTVNCTVRWLTYIVEGPPGDLAMFGRTIATLQRNVLNDLFDIVGTDNYKWINRQQGVLRVFNRRIYCFGASNEDAESKIRGATFAGALCDEVNLYPKSVFNQLMARLSVKGAQCFCNCNPDSPYHWFYTDYIQNEKITDKKIWQFLMDDNYSLDRDYIESLKQMYTGVWYDRMIKGEWVAADGMIYDMFDAKKHMVDTLSRLPKVASGKYSLQIEWFVGCDYGTSTVMTWSLFAEYKGTFYKVREYYYDAPSERRQMTDYEFGSEFERWLRASLPADVPIGSIKFVYCDPSAASWKAELRGRGYRVKDADNDVINGIRTVGTKLAIGDFLIDKSCKNTELEYANYHWDPDKQEKGEDKPVKMKDHTCDADRYVIYSESKYFLSGVY